MRHAVGNVVVLDVSRSEDEAHRIPLHRALRGQVKAYERRPDHRAAGDADAVLVERKVARVALAAVEDDKEDEQRGGHGEQFVVEFAKDEFGGIGVRRECHEEHVRKREEPKEPSRQNQGQHGPLPRDQHRDE